MKTLILLNIVFASILSFADDSSIEQQLISAQQEIIRLQQEVASLKQNRRLDLANVDGFPNKATCEVFKEKITTEIETRIGEGAFRQDLIFTADECKPGYADTFYLSGLELLILKD